MSVLDEIVKDTHYRNQFETFKSKGTYNHSRRIVWENKLFDNLYGLSTSNGYERPKYGSLCISNKINKSIHNYYGNCYFTLNDIVKKRTTFTLGDTGAQSGNTPVFSLDYSYICYSIINNNIKSPIKHMQTCYTYIEVQIHGPINIATDIISIHIPNNYVLKKDTLKNLKDKGIQIIRY